MARRLVAALGGSPEWCKRNAVDPLVFLLLPDDLDATAYTKAACLKIDVAPAQTEELAASQPRAYCHCYGCLQFGFARCCQEALNPAPV